jgi:UDP-N-acetylmuramate--alanine ligase
MFDTIRHIYFLGIGGIGMSALAKYFHGRGIRVSGYDKTPSDITDELIAAGMPVHFEDNVELLPSGIDLVVITPAIPADHKEWRYLRDLGLPIRKRAEVLGMISGDAVCLAVAGTHGKTTTTTMLTHLLKSSGVNCTAFLGGISANFMTNYVPGDPRLVVVEADEYDRSFLHLSPAGAIITSMDADHLDIYGDHSQVTDSYKSFAERIRKDGTLVLKAGIDPGFNENFRDRVRIRNYGINVSLNSATDVRVENGAFVFDYKGERESVPGLHLSVPGRHNVENAVAAITLALEFGANAEGIKKGIQSFLGVHRRFEFALRTDSHVVIDDYAHHPEELKAAISAARELYPHKKITGVFQPHLFSRTRDFADQFARSLEMLDTVILLDIYPARELPIAGITSEMLLNRISSASKFICGKEQLVSLIEEQNPEVTLIMGAGDIDRLVKPVAHALKSKGGRT